jgi:hypothetical protein
MKTLVCSFMLILAMALTGCSRQSAQTCVAGTGEICASDITLKELDEQHVVEDKYKAPVLPQDVKLRYLGILTDINSARPKGYKMDDKKRRWVVCQAIDAVCRFDGPAPVTASTPAPAPTAANSAGAAAPAQ